MIEFTCWQVGTWKKFSTPIFTEKTLLLILMPVPFCVLNANDKESFLFFYS